MAARRRLERAEAAGQALAALGLPALVLDSGGKVLAANELIQASPLVAHWCAADRAALDDPRADELLREALARTDGMTMAACAPSRFATRRARM